MNSPVERLEQWCDQQEARQMRWGQGRNAEEFWPMVDAYRRIIDDYRTVKCKRDSSGLDSFRNSMSYRVDGHYQDIRTLADALNPEPNESANE